LRLLIPRQLLDTFRVPSSRQTVPSKYCRHIKIKYFAITWSQGRVIAWYCLLNSSHKDRQGLAQCSWTLQTRFGFCFSWFRFSIPRTLSITLLWSNG
jgi:hypothetical protein